MHNVIERTVAEMSDLTPATAQTMHIELVYVRTTMLTGVWSAEGRVESEASGDTHLLSSMCRPMDDRGRACSHAPDSLEVAAKMWAQDLAPTVLSNRSSIVAVTLGISQALWLFCSASTGGTRLGVEAHLPCASDQFNVAGGPGGI